MEPPLSRLDEVSIFFQGASLALALIGPLLAWLFHEHFHKPITPRSMLIASLVMECPALGVFSMTLSVRISNGVWHTLLLIGAYLVAVAPAFLLRLVLADGRRPAVPARRGGDAGQPPEEGA